MAYDPLQGHRAPSLVVWWQPDMAAWDQRRAKVAGRAYGLEDAQQIGYGVTAQHPRARVRVTTAWFDGVRTLPGDLLYDTGQDEDEWRAEAANERNRPAGAQELPRLRRRGGAR